MTSTALPHTSVTTQVYRVFIKATPQAIWDAITTPEWTQRYGYGLRDMYELRLGGAYRGHATAGMLMMGMPDVVADGEVIESDPPAAGTRLSGLRQETTSRGTSATATDRPTP